VDAEEWEQFIDFVMTLLEGGEVSAA
jgi:hypothetical protein